MKIYFNVCNKYSKSKNPKISISVCNSKKLKFIKEQKARGLLGTFTEVKVLITSNLTVANILL